jgi:hypothetical protein
LVDGAEMPDPEKRPESPAPLSRRNALRLTLERFKADMRRLVIAIGKLWVRAAEEIKRREESVRRAAGGRREAKHAQREAEHAEAGRRALAERQRAEAERAEEARNSEQAPGEIEEANSREVEKGKVSGAFRGAALAALVAIVVVGIIAMLFIKEFRRPTELAAPLDLKPITQPAADQEPQSAPAAPPQPVEAVAPITQRAALLVQASDDHKQLRTYVGTVVWRQEPVNNGQAEPMLLSVRADIDVPEAKLKATIILQKNKDTALPASHIFEVRFMPADGSPIPDVKQIDVPELRDAGQVKGDALSGVPVPITQNYFQIGLTQSDVATTRNIALIKSRGWLDIPVQLSDNRIGKLTFEKGDTGDRIVANAVATWN